MSALLDTAILISLLIFALSMVITLIRLIRGPSAQDRVLALDYLYITAMLMMLVLVSVMPVTHISKPPC